MRRREPPAAAGGASPSLASRAVMFSRKITESESKARKHPSREGQDEGTEVACGGRRRPSSRARSNVLILHSLRRINQCLCCRRTVTYTGGPAVAVLNLNLFSKGGQKKKKKGGAGLVRVEKRCGVGGPLHPPTWPCAPRPRAELPNASPRGLSGPLHSILFTMNCAGHTHTLVTGYGVWVCLLRAHDLEPVPQGIAELWFVRYEMK